MYIRRDWITKHYREDEKNVGELVTLQALHRQTKLASPLLPDISVDS